MGLEVKRNDDNQYQLISTITDKPYHDEEWISEDEAKKILITNKFWDYVEECLKVEHNFPEGYRINDVFPKKRTQYLDWYDKNVDVSGIEGDKVLILEFDKLFKRLDLGIQIGTNPNNVWKVGAFYFPGDDFPHITPNWCERLVKGTKEEAIEYLKNDFLLLLPEDVRDKIDLNLDSKNRSRIFIEEVEIKNLDDE